MVHRLISSKLIKIFTTLLLLVSTFIGQIGPFFGNIAQADSLPLFDQNQGGYGGYQIGKYDFNAIQPTSTNWTRQSKFTGINSPYTKWAVPASETWGTNLAVGSDGTIYVSVINDATHFNGLKAVNPDGTLKWTYATNFFVSTSPCIGSDGTIYFADDMGEFYALNPDGSLKWMFQSNYESQQGTPAIGPDGTIYFSAAHRINSFQYIFSQKLFAFNEDGSQKWSVDIVDGGSPSSSGSPIIGNDGTIYLVTDNYKLYALNPDGSKKWSYPANGYSDPAVDKNGVVYISSGDGFLALNPDGTLKWKYNSNSVNGDSAPAIGSDGTIYYINWDASLYAMNPDGTLKWSFMNTNNDNNDQENPTIGADGIIYYGTDYGNFYAINPDGTLKWSIPTDNSFEGIASAPVINKDGTIYLSGDSLSVLATSNTGSTSSISGVNAVQEISKYYGEMPNGEMSSSYYASDPVNTSTGAHEISHTLLKASGEEPLIFNIKYNSLLLNVGSLGKGWEDDYEARLESTTSGNVIIHWSANHANSYNSIGNNQYSSPDLVAQYDTLVKESDGSYTLTRNDQSIYHFNSSGQLVQKQNGHGQSQMMTYDTTNHLTTVAEPISGQSLNFVYNTNGFIDTVSDNLNRHVKFTYDTNQNLTEITDANGKTTTYTYDSNGRVLTGTDAEGVTLFTDTVDTQGRVVSQKDSLAISQPSTFSYDESGQPGKIITTVTDRNGNVKIITHDSKYELLSMKDELGNTTTYSYDSNGNQTGETDALGNSSTFSYDNRGNLLTATDATGNITMMTYDSRNNLLTKVNAAGKQSTFTYDTNNNLTSSIDMVGNQTTFTYDNNGLLVSKTSPNLGTTTFSYQNGLLQSLTDPTGKSTTYGYDTVGRAVYTINGGIKTTYTHDSADNLTSVSDALGNTTSFTFDSHGDKLTQTDANGHVTSYSYNGNGKLISQTDALNNTTTYQYDGEDRLIKVTDAKGNITTMNRDAKGRIISVTNPLGNTVSTQYDAVDNIVGKTDAMGNQNYTATYDALHNPLTEQDALGRTITYHYDLLHRRDQVTNALGNSTKYLYDDLNRLVSSTDALNQISSQSYDADGNRVALVDPNNNQTTFTFDKADRLIQVQLSSNNKITYEYNDLGQLAKMTNGRGQVTTYQYNDAGRLASVTDPTGTMAYTYDANGNILTASDDTGTVTRSYDSLNRLTSYTDVYGNTIQYGYDVLGHLTSITYPDGKVVKYDYDFDRLTQVTDWAGRITKYTYDANRRLTATTRPDGSVESRTYDIAGQLLKVSDADKTGSLINEFVFTYDGAGDILSEKNTVTNVVYSMTNSALQQLSQEQVVNQSSGAVPYQYNYTYDAGGNIVHAQNTVKTDDQSPAVTSDVYMTYTSDNRVATFNNQPVTYDADGNMTNGPLGGQMVNYQYDAKNRLITDGSVTYTYDVNNNRVAVAQNGNTSHYVINPNASLSQVLMETDATGNPKVYYVYGIGLIGQEDASGNYLAYHYDKRGSTIALTDTSGAVTDRFEYSPYGGLLQHSGSTTTPFLYNGRAGVMTDSNGLYYMRSRYYNPEVYRFINQDTMLGSIDNGQTLNRYAYVNGQPISYLDPFGLSRDSNDSLDNNNESFAKKILNVLFLDDWNTATNSDASISTRIIAGGSLVLNVGLSVVSDGEWAAVKPVASKFLGKAFEFLKDENGFAKFFRNDDLPLRSNRGTPHTELRKDVDGKNIISGREFDSQGNPVRDVDLRSRSGRNDHEFPHQHEYQLQPDGNWTRQDARPLNPDWPGTPPNGISK